MHLWQDTKQHVMGRMSVEEVWLLPGVRKGWVSPTRHVHYWCVRDCFLWAHLLSLALTAPEGGQRPLRHPLLSERCVSHRSPSHMEAHRSFFYSPLQTWKPHHLVPAPIRKEGPGHRWTVFPNFVVLSNFSRKNSLQWYIFLEKIYLILNVAEKDMCNDNLQILMPLQC